MKTLFDKLARFLISEDGPTVVEYAFMLALLLILCIAAITAIGGKVAGTFTILEADLPGGS